MKKIFCYVIFILISFAIIITFPKADSCNYKEQATLNKEAKNIKINYEIVKLELPEGYYFTEDGISDPNGNDVTAEYFEYYNGKYIKLIITNLPEDFYFKIEDEDLIKANNNQDTYNFYDQSDGIVELKMNVLSEYKNIKFSFYSNKCGGKSILDKYLKIPRSNPYYNMALCEGIPDYKYCQEFLASNVKDETIINKVLQYKKSLEKQEVKTQKESNWKKITFMSAIAVVIAGILVFLIILIQKHWRAKKI